MQSDIKKLQGRWLQVSYERDGVKEPVDNEYGWQPVTEISGNTFTVTIAGGKTILGGIYKLDATKNPKTIDWIDTSGSYASEQPILAIYSLSAKEFIFCASYDGSVRPTEFITKPGQVLRRMQRLE